MAKIKQLSVHEAQKIAAGEVVERPANVVKELLENSIDAGATAIALYIEQAGKQLIRVVDDGCGMSLDDARMCFAHHATSKLSSVDDLIKIDTFGFRGEALATITAVSHVTLTTKEADTHEGIQLSITKNKIIEEKVVPCPTGTDISVKNIFYNVPARKKFLRAKETEWRQISQLFHAFCFDYPHIHFKLFSEGKQVHNCPATDTVSTRMTQLWNHTNADQMITIEGLEEKNINITGVISNHQYARYDRNQIFFFVNKRWVKNYTLSRALLKGYMNVLPHSKFPAACIFVSIASETVDINIHPRKEEVQFLNPRIVERAITQAVKIALENNLSSHIKQDVTFASADYTPPPMNQKQDWNNTQFDFPPVHRQPSVLNQSIDAEPFTDIPPIPANKTITQQATVQDQIQTTVEEQQPDTNFNLIDQFSKTYILIEKPDGLFLVDQHAAHERILYEQFCKRFEDIATVSLIFPQMINLSPADIDLLEPHLNLFTDNGIALERFANDQLIVNATPVHLKEISLVELIKQTVGWICEQQSATPEQFTKNLHNKIRAMMACKAAVKAGDILDKQQMEQLLSDLEKCPNKLTCPHGRPTGLLLRQHEIEKRFKRIV